MKKAIFLLMTGLIFNSCQKFSSSYNTETPTETPIETPIKEKNISTNEFSEKFPKKYTFDNLYIEDYSYEPMLYKTYERHYVQFKDEKVIISNYNNVISYRFHIDSIKFKKDEENEGYLLYLHNNKYKNAQMVVLFSWDYISIFLNDHLKMCFENLDPKTQGRNIGKNSSIYFKEKYFILDKEKYLIVN